MGAGSGVDAGMAPSDYRIVNHDVVGEIRITTSPDVTDGSQVTARGETGIHFITASTLFNSAGLIALDQAAIAAGNLPGATVLTPVAAPLPNLGHACAEQIIANFAESVGCDPATGQNDATLAGGLAAACLANGNINVIAPNPASRLILSDRKMAITSGCHHLVGYNGVLAKTYRRVIVALAAWTNVAAAVRAAIDPIIQQGGTPEQILAAAQAVCPDAQPGAGADPIDVPGPHITIRGSQMYIPVAGN